MQKIYIGCGLTHATLEFGQEIDSLKTMLRGKYEILDFQELEKYSAKDAYHHCIKQIKTSDLFLAECSHPSTAMGFKIALALSSHKPVLAVAKPEAAVSRIILGIDSSLFTFLRYNSAEEVADAVEKKLAGVI